MSDKLARKVKQNQETAEEEINSLMSGQYSEKDTHKALLMVGAVAAVNQIQNMLNAQTIRGLQRIRDEKLFEPLGYARFDFFLDMYEHAPMNYKKFNEREKLLEAEGDALFDVLNTLKLSHRERKLLGAGNVQVEGDTVFVIGGDSKSQVEEININDRTRLLQTLSALADQVATQASKIEKGSKQVEDLQRKLDDAKSRPGQVSVDTLHFESATRATTALKSLIEVVKNLPTAQKAKYADIYLADILLAAEDLKAAYGRTNFQTENAEPATDGEFSSVLSQISDEDDEL